MTVLENVVAGAVFGHRRRWGHEADAHADAMLDRVGLEGKGHLRRRATDLYRHQAGGTGARAGQ